MKKLQYHKGSDKKKFVNVRNHGRLAIVRASLTIATKEYVHEVEVMSKLSHENVIRLIGFVEDLENGQACIVVAWEPNGNLSEFLTCGEWAIPERISLIRDTFKGINYLHTRRPPICHGDLKSLNILVSSTYRAIITDFGSAREVNVSKAESRSQQDRQQGIDNPVTEEAGLQPQVSATENQLTLTGPAFSLRWASPEIVNGDPPALPCDIWAAGWICWEVMTNEVPFFDLKEVSAITLRVIKGNLPLVHKDSQLAQVIRLCSLMTDCWKLAPNDRPSIGKCVNEVHSMPWATPFDRTSPDSTQRSLSLLIQRGELLWDQANLDSAVPLFQEALSIATLEGNERAQAVALWWLGSAYRIQSKATDAEETLIQAREIFTRMDDEVGQAKTMSALAQLYTAGDRYKEAMELLLKVKSLYIRTGASESHASTLLEIGTICRLHKQMALATEACSEARDIYIRERNIHGEAYALVALGRIYMSDGESRWMEVEKNLARALEIFIRFGDSLGRANTLRSFGHLRLEQGRKTEAAAHYADARDTYHQVPHPAGEANASYWLAQASEPEEDLSVANLVID
ncbi:hypothetical protein FRC01_006277 [Tulasnella sp. 417]|nr:hypothetical protein FRC01_006277 [Tulasnella sp. 417]